MILRINSEIMELIKNDVDENTFKILKQFLLLEAERNKTKYPRFTEDYDNIIDNFTVE